MSFSCSKIAFSPDGKWLAVASGGQKSVMSVRDVQTGKEICSIPTNDLTTGLAFPRNNMLIHAGSRIVRVFELSLKKK
jgi:WD40 repeat protein